VGRADRTPGCGVVAGRPMGARRLRGTASPGRGGGRSSGEPDSPVRARRRERGAKPRRGPPPAARGVGRNEREFASSTGCGRMDPGSFGRRVRGPGSRVPRPLRALDLAAGERRRTFRASRRLRPCPSLHRQADGRSGVRHQCSPRRRSPPAARGGAPACRCGHRLRRMRGRLAGGRGYDGLSTGKVTSNVEPSPTSLWQVTEPPC
jgi:hypothetical protein